MCQLELCQYLLDDQPKEVRRAHTAVIMCRVRRNVLDPKRWDVQALGHLCNGKAGCLAGYAGMEKAIRELRGREGAKKAT